MAMSEEKTVTNMAIRAAYDSLGGVMGDNARKIIFKAAGLLHVIDSPPEPTFDRSFTLSEQAAIYRETINLVGAIGAQGILRQMGYKNVEIGVTTYHALDSIKELAPGEKIIKCFEFSHTVLNKGRIVIGDDGLPRFDVFDCLTCEGARSEKPYCSQYGGGLQFMTDWTYGKGVMQVVEETCKAMGHDTCLFVLRKR
jgi:predicted hydrocarbon binding protein